MPSSQAARIQFNGSGLVPCPYINIQRNHQKVGDTRIIGTLYNISLSNEFVYYRGSPNSSGIFSTGVPADELSSIDAVSSLFNKTEALRALFNKDNDGKSLVGYSCDNVILFSGNPRISSISLPEGPYNQTANYSIELEADELFGTLYPAGSENYPQFIESASESWSLEFDETPLNETVGGQHIFRLSHEVSAKGKRHYSPSGTLPSGAWEQAKSYVVSRLGFDTQMANGVGVVNLSGLNHYNYYRTQNLDKDDGTFSATETFMLSSGNAREEFTVTSNSSVTDAIQTVSIEGAVYGMETISYGTTSGDFNVTQTKYNAASGLFVNTVLPNLYTRVQVYGETFLRPMNSTPLSYSIGRNPSQGVINYNYTYDTRIAPIVSGALTETLTISDTNPHDVFAIITVLGRTKGPVLQSIGTKTENVRTISYEAIFLPTGTANPTTSGAVTTLMALSPKSSVQPIFDAFAANLSGANQIYKSSDQETWTPRIGQYQKSVSYTWVLC